MRIQQFSFILIIDYISTENGKTRIRLPLYQAAIVEGGKKLGAFAL
jgi:hypothetical protein